MEEQLNFAELLKAIPGENPAGVDLRQNLASDSLYQQVKNIRTKVRAQEREIVMGSDVDSVSIREAWQKIAELASHIISEQAKDLEVAAWLTEALTRCRNFAGLGNSYPLIRQLIEPYWEQLYPLPDEEGLETRLAALAGLNGESANGTLISPIYCISLTRTDIAAFSAWHYQMATGDSSDQSSVTLGMIETAVLESGSDFARALIKDIQYAIEEYQSVCVLLDQKCGINFSPPSSKIQNALNFCLETAQKMYQKVLKDNPLTLMEVTTDSSSEQGDTMTSLSNSNSINSRQVALQHLAQIAAYFREHEPNSPVPHLVEQAIRWGNMPLPQLLAEIIHDDAVLRYAYQLIGAKESTQDETE